jgi:hypothetical protein
MADVLPQNGFCPLPYLAKHHTTKNLIEPKYAPGPRAQYGRALWRSNTVLVLVGVPSTQEFRHLGVWVVGMLQSFSTISSARRWDFSSFQLLV